MSTANDRRTVSTENLSLYSQAILGLRPVLAPSFAQVSAWRLARYARQQETLPVPVISLGNLTFGGTGKTPITISLARWLHATGRKPGVITNGFGGVRRERGALVSDGTHIFLPAREVGEEAILLAHALNALSIPVAAGRHREAMGRLLLQKTEVDCLILDDGFQYRSLQREVDLCVVDATNPFGAGGAEEYGFLREPPAALARASTILLTKANLIPLLELPDRGTLVHRDWVLEELARWAPNVPVAELPVTDTHLELAWDPATQRRDPDPIADPLQPASPTAPPPEEPFIGTPTRLLPICALGNPEAFEATCRLAGLDFRHPVRYDDHTHFSSGDLMLWNQLHQRMDHQGIVVSSKDWVKIHPLRHLLTMPCWVLTMRLDLPDWPSLITL